MPIKPKNKDLYPANWKWIREQILIRAGYRCEGSPRYPDCKAKNGQPHPETGAIVVLTVAHLDNDPANCDGMETGGPVKPLAQSNLRAWCQRCHLSYDAKFHQLNAAKTRRNKAYKAGQLSLLDKSNAGPSQQ